MAIMSYDAIMKCTDIATLQAQADKLRPRLYGPHGARLTEAQNKHGLCKGRIHELKKLEQGAK